MKRRLAKMKRILSVRDTQMKLSEHELAKAGHRYRMLEENAERIRKLQTATRIETAEQHADMLSAGMELFGRLMQAESNMAVSISEAREDLAGAERQNLAAKANFESTEKLFENQRKHASKTATFKANNQINLLYNNKNMETRNDD